MFIILTIINPISNDSHLTLYLTKNLYVHRFIYVVIKKLNYDAYKWVRSFDSIPISMLVYYV